MTINERSSLRRLFREPLLHCIALGALIYAAYAITDPPPAESEASEKTLTVTAGEQEWLASNWYKRWGRLPTQKEFDGLIRQHIRETVLYREALALGLEKDDVVIRRRLGQKFEFLSQDVLQPNSPEEAELRAYFEENIDRYRRPDRITLTHIFFDPDKRGDSTLDNAENAKAELATLTEVPADLSIYGDRFMLQTYYPAQTEADIARLFGSGFAAPVFQLEPGSWHGPVLSGYGTHLVYVHERISEPAPDFTSVVDAVTADWLEEKRRELNDTFINSLLESYTVVIEEIRVEGEPVETGTGQ